MAFILPVNGDAQPVFAIDTQNGPVDSDTYLAGVPTNLAGPALDFFGIDLGADPSGQAGVNQAILAVLQATQQLATVAIYQVAATANVTNMSMAVYPVSAWTAATLQAAIRAIGNVSTPYTYNFTGATVTNVGFRLASTATTAS
jgi:hypothetical protein